jgi:hypothetical protein
LQLLRLRRSVCCGGWKNWTSRTRAVRHLKDLPDFEGKDSELLAEPEDDVLEDFPMDEDKSCDSQDGNDEPIRLDDQCSEIEPEPVTVSWMLPRPSVQF